MSFCCCYRGCTNFIILQLSYAASSVEFQDDFKYFFLFTNTPSTSAFNKARLTLIQYFGWKRVAILREYDDQLHTEVQWFFILKISLWFAKSNRFWIIKAYQPYSLLRCSGIEWEHLLRVVLDKRPRFNLLQAVNDLRNQIIEDNLNITLITIEGFNRQTKGHPRVQLENLQVRSLFCFLIYNNDNNNNNNDNNNDNNKWGTFS